MGKKKNFKNGIKCDVMSLGGGVKFVVWCFVLSFLIVNL